MFDLSILYYLVIDSGVNPKILWSAKLGGFYSVEKICWQYIWEWLQLLLKWIASIWWIFSNQFGLLLYKFYLLNSQTSLNEIGVPQIFSHIGRFWTALFQLCPFFAISLMSVQVRQVLQVKEDNKLHVPMFNILFFILAYYSSETIFAI